MVTQISKTHLSIKYELKRVCEQVSCGITFFQTGGGNLINADERKNRQIIINSFTRSRWTRAHMYAIVKRWSKPTHFSTAAGQRANRWIGRFWCWNVRHTNSSSLWILHSTVAQKCLHTIQFTRQRGLHNNGQNIADLHLSFF